MNNKSITFKASISIFIALALLGGCATDKSGDVTSETDERSAVELATPTTRTVTFAPIFFDGWSQEDAVSELQDKGYTDIMPQEDGSYTVTMTIGEYNELVDALYASVSETLDGLANSEDYPSIIAVEYDDTFSTIKFTSSKFSLDLTEMFIDWSAAIPACMYQQIAGQPVSTTITVFDADGGIIQEATYPDAWDQGEADKFDSR